MADDIVPALNAEINRVFERELMTDRRVARLGGLIRDGTKDFEVAYKYSQRTGAAMSKALRDTLRAGNLPNDTIYYNIAERTVAPALKRVHSLTTEAASTVQRSIDAAEEIGLSPIVPEFPAERTAGLIDKIASSETLERAQVWLGEAIVNNAESYIDDFIRENAAFRDEAGLDVTITRESEAGCCEWCAKLAGSYRYGEHPDEIFQRHEYCRCSVTYKSGRTSQDVWSKRKWSTPSELEERRQMQPEETPRSERIRNAEERAARDEEIRLVMNATGWTRREAAEVTRRSKLPVAEIIKTYGRR